ncbi:metal-sensitive transcriptional regulator [Haliangium ochraceum]|uniref:Transcriptional regulator n=1 Tax=Haliangium ochraceum (strain DSM 14365 / JCM 11303 / SMP-2) TaxID=502025 RepID=D0LXT5_HALO1|nr:metal-sensitive transcriptional regulator [Haliangium ochraceum]ACY14290.1 protein of unknown function DUF156 [Haliangium ochraceum DSM 14365]
MMGPSQKKNVETRLKRIAGQVDGIQRMVAEDRYCVDVLLQISAVRAALSKVSGILLESHIHTCVTKAFDSDDPAERDEKIAELVRIFGKNGG